MHTLGTAATPPALPPWPACSSHAQRPRSGAQQQHCLRAAAGLPSPALCGRPGSRLHMRRQTCAYANIHTGRQGTLSLACTLLSYAAGCSTAKAVCSAVSVQQHITRQTALGLLLESSIRGRTAPAAHLSWDSSHLAYGPYTWSLSWLCPASSRKASSQRSSSTCSASSPGMSSSFSRPSLAASDLPGDSSSSSRRRQQQQSTHEQEVNMQAQAASTHMTELTVIFGTGGDSL